MSWARRFCFSAAPSYMLAMVKSDFSASPFSMFMMLEPLAHEPMAVA